MGLLDLCLLEYHLLNKLYGTIYNYEKSIKPVIDFYKETKLLKVVNGETSISEITDEISDLIEGIKGWLWEIRQYKYALNIKS